MTNEQNLDPIKNCSEFHSNSALISRAFYFRSKNRIHRIFPLSASVNRAKISLISTFSSSFHFFPSLERSISDSTKSKVNPWKTVSSEKKRKEKKQRYRDHDFLFDSHSSSSSSFFLYLPFSRSRSPCHVLIVSPTFPFPFEPLLRRT